MEDINKEVNFKERSQ